MDRFVDLQTLVAVGQTRSISQAAARISTTKSVVSQRLTLLERRLNVQLIVRQSRGVSLTEAGQRLANWVGQEMIYQHLRVTA